MASGECRTMRARPSLSAKETTTPSSAATRNSTRGVGDRWVSSSRAVRPCKSSGGADSGISVGSVRQVRVAHRPGIDIFEAVDHSLECEIGADMLRRKVADICRPRGICEVTYDTGCERLWIVRWDECAKCRLRHNLRDSADVAHDHWPRRCHRLDDNLAKRLRLCRQCKNGKGPHPRRYVAPVTHEMHR